MATTRAQRIETQALHHWKNHIDLHDEAKPHHTKLFVDTYERQAKLNMCKGALWDMGIKQHPIVL